MNHLLKYYGTKTKISKKDKEEIKTLTSFLPLDVKIKQRLWHIKHQTDKIPKCKICKEETKWSNSKEYQTYCSVKCMSNDTEIKQQRKQTNLEKYGVEYASQSLEIKQKVKETCINRYGVSNVRQTEQVKQKNINTKKEKYGTGNNLVAIKQTNLEKYGVEYAIASNEVKEKIKQTNLEKYGVEYAIASNEVKEKIKQTNLEKYGVEYIVYSDNFKQKQKQTNLEKYGVEHAITSEIIKEKIKQTNLEKYGVEYPFQNQQFQQNARNKIIEKYGRYNSQRHINPDAINKLNDKNWLYEQHYTQHKSLVEIALELNVNDTTVGRYLHNHGLETQHYSLGFICEKWFKNNEDKKEIPSHLYVINFYDDNESFIKIGITTNSAEHRSKEIPYDKNIILEIELPLFVSYSIEQHLLNELKFFRYIPKKCFGGQFECLDRDALIHIYEILTQN